MLRDQAVAGLARQWVSRPWAADFRLIVSPMAWTFEDRLEQLRLVAELAA